ncbi:hypothetical protein CGL51_11750 [Pyrobaculum aerophilum]|uniref:Glycosyl transferase family 1 domain-containing protein n=2 Tax=Pyrobaculum aerophilum TaxID=13773 RepID=A0A371QV80_9CREN|nr:hypothetical protein CGL51_11750 [Pyrobaculum aerophilum]
MGPPLPFNMGRALPYAVMESMALGTTPVSCKVGGVPEVVKRSIAEAYLLEPCDSATLVDKIIELSSIGKNDLIEIALRLRNHALNLFNEKYIETKLASLFSQLLDGSNLEPTL